MLKKTLLILAICLIACFNLRIAVAYSGDVYFLDDNHRYFDFSNMNRVNLDSKQVDLRFGSTGSAWYFQPYNGAAIIDLGTIDFERATAPASGYSVERMSIKQDHVYAVKCGDGIYGLLKVTNYNNEAGVAEFFARLTLPFRSVNLYYLSGDNLRFDFETMKNTINSHESDLYFRYNKTSINGENGTTLKDLGVINFGYAKAPLYGYTTGELKAVKDHVYAVRSSNQQYYLIKITNVNNESDIEFMIRTTEPESATSPAQTQPVNDLSAPDQQTDLENALISGGPDQEIGQLTDEPVTTKSAPVIIPTNNNQTNSPVIKGEIQGGQYLYKGKVIFKIQGTLDWACISPNEKYIAYRDGQEINYYDIEKKKYIGLYRLTTDEYMGKYVYNYGFTSPTNYDFVRWSEDNKYIVVKRWTKDMFKGGSGNYKITITDKTMTAMPN